MKQVGYWAFALAVLIAGCGTETVDAPSAQAELEEPTSTSNATRDTAPTASTEQTADVVLCGAEDLQLEATVADQLGREFEVDRAAPDANSISVAAEGPVLFEVDVVNDTAKACATPSSIDLVVRDSSGNFVIGIGTDIDCFSDECQHALKPGTSTTVRQAWDGEMIADNGVDLVTAPPGLYTISVEIGASVDDKREAISLEFGLSREVVE